jgi:ParB family transcriptional regulator, chromosome partitioning protein
MNKRGLGRGLDALLAGGYPADTRESVSEVSVSDIVPNRFQPRKEFDSEKLADLAESVKRYGVLQPVVVRRQEQGYELVAGERRWRASQIAGLKVIPALVRDYSDIEMTAVALVENLQRENLNPMEEAHAYRRLIDEFGFTQEEVSQQVGKSRPFIANAVRLLNLPQSVQDYVSRGTMSPGQARPLLVLPTPGLQMEAASEILAHALTARDAEELARRWTKKAVTDPVKRQKANEKRGETEIAERLSARLGTRVRVTERGEGSGIITIEYYSEEELQRILEYIEGERENKHSEHYRNKGIAFSV